MSPESGRARAILLRLLLSALSWLPAGIAVAATPKAGEKRICVPSADGKAWECGTPDNPPPERGLPAVLDPGTGAPPPTFLAAPPSDPPHVYAAPPPAPAQPLPDQFPSVQRGDTTSPAPEPAAEPVADAGGAGSAPATELPAPATAEAHAAPAPATVDSGVEALAPPPFLAAPPVRRPVPLAPVLAPAEAAREEVLAATPVDPGPAAPPPASDAPVAAVPPAAGTDTPQAEMPAVAGSPGEAGFEPAAASVPPVEPAPLPMPDTEPRPPAVAEPVAEAATTSKPVAVEAPATEAAAIPGPPAFEEPVAQAGVNSGQPSVAEPAVEAAATAAPPRVAEPVADAAAISGTEPPEAAPAEAPATIEPAATSAAETAQADIAPASDAAAPGESTDAGAMERAPAPVAAPSPATESPPTRPAVVLPLQAPAEFLRLPAGAWTAQLGRSAGRVDGALAAIGSDARAIADPIYLVAVGAADARQWLLLWSRFDDAEAARRALRAAGLRGVPRRIGPLQAEIRAAGTLAPPAYAGVRAASPMAAAGAAPDWQPAPPSRGDVAALALPGAARFEALPADAWTVQLARAGSSAGFAALMARAGLAPTECHVVALAGNGVRSYLLLWSQFPDADAARAAARSLRGAPGAFVRRIGPLQAEARRAR